MINSLDMNQILLGLIHDLDSRWTSYVTLCYLTITDTNKCMPCKYQKSQQRHCPAHLPDFILDIVRWLTMSGISRLAPLVNVNVLLSMHIYTRAESSPGNLSQFYFTVPLLQSLPGKGVGVKVKLGTDKKLRCLLPFSPPLIPLT